MERAPKSGPAADSPGPAESSGSAPRPGDVIVLSPQQTSGTGSAFRTGVAKFMGKRSVEVQGPYTHSAIVTGPDEMVESRYESGVVKRTLADGLEGKDYVVLRPNLPRDVVADAVRFAKAQVGKGYDRGAMVRAAAGAFLPEKATQKLSRLRDLDRDAVDAWTCSSIIAAAYGDALPVGSKMSAPADFLRSEHFRRVGERRSGDGPEAHPIIGRFRRRAGDEKRADYTPEPGDIVVMSPRAPQPGKKQGVLDKVLWSNLNPRVQGGLTHAALVAGDGSIVESREGEGVTKKTFDKAVEGKTYVVRRPDLSAEERRRAAEWAEKQVGRPYGWGQLRAGAAGAVLPKRILDVVGPRLGNRKPRDSWTCSGFLTEAYGPNKITDVPGHLAMPGDLRFSSKLRTVEDRAPGAAKPVLGRLRGSEEGTPKTAADATPITTATPDAAGASLHQSTRGKVLPQPKITPKTVGGATFSGMKPIPSPVLQARGRDAMSKVLAGVAKAASVEPAALRMVGWDAFAVEVLTPAAALEKAAAEMDPDGVPRKKVTGLKQPRLATPRLNPEAGAGIPSNPFRVNWKKLDPENGVLQKISGAPGVAAKLQPGDVVVLSTPTKIAPPKNRIHGAIWNTWNKNISKFQGEGVHSAIVASDGKTLIESQANTGVRRQTLGQVTRNRKYVVRRPQVSLARRRQAAEWAEKQVGKAYSWGDLGLETARMFVPNKAISAVEKRLDHSRDRPAYTCSSLITAAYDKTPLTKFRGRGASPADLNYSSKLKTVVNKVPKAELPTIGQMAKEVKEPGVLAKIAAEIPESVRHGLLGAAALGGGLMLVRNTASQAVNPHPSGVGLGAGARTVQRVVEPLSNVAALPGPQVGAVY